MDSGQRDISISSQTTSLFLMSLTIVLIERWQILLAATDFETPYVLYEEKRQNLTEHELTSKKGGTSLP